MDKYSYIYIMTNKSFEGHDWVKIGYSKNPEKRRKELSNTSVPFEYEIYATYKVEQDKNQLDDIVLHTLIQTLNPDLRLNQNREFFEMTPETAFLVLESIAKISNTENKLTLYKKPQQMNIARKESCNFNKEVIASKIIDYLDKNNKIIVLTRGNIYQRFTTPTIRNRVGLIGDGSWSGIKDMIAYELKLFDNNYIKLTLIIGPGDDKDRNDWLHFALEQGKPFIIKGSTTSHGKWKRIYHHTLVDVSKYSTEDEVSNATISALDKFFSTTFEEFEEIFK